jgi:hypothetical protein
MIGMVAGSRSFAALAMVAALLLALAPTTSRLLSGADAGPPVPVATCPDAGAHAAIGHPAMQEPRPLPMTVLLDDACGHCALLAPLPPPRAVWVAAAADADGTLRRHHAAPVLGWPRNLRGLGSQAPPSLA